MMYRGTKRGGISVAEVTQRLLAQYPTDLDEATTRRMVSRTIWAMKIG